jgi:integrase/recombinase XerD
VAALWCRSGGAEADQQPRPSTGRPAAPSSIARALSALSGLYRNALDERLIDRSPTAAVCRPKVADDSQATGLTRTELRALLAAADGARAHALLTLLALNGLRIDEALSRDVLRHRPSTRGFTHVQAPRRNDREPTISQVGKGSVMSEGYRFLRRTTGPPWTDHPHRSCRHADLLKHAPKAKVWRLRRRSMLPSAE